MPPGTAQDAAKDPNFLKASVPDQMDYLAHVDPEFKNASSADKLAYLAHVTGKQAPTTENNSVENASAKEGGWGEFGKGMAKAPLAPVATLSGWINKIPGVGETLAPSAGVQAEKQLATPQNKSQEIGTTAADRAATWIPMATGVTEAAMAGKLVPFAKRAATSIVGGLAGREAGKYGGALIGGKTGAEIGEAAGGAIGGLAGGGAFGEKYRKIGNPSELPVVGKYLPDLLGEKAALPTVGAGAPAPETPAVSSAPFELKADPYDPAPAVQQKIEFPAPPAAEAAPAAAAPKRSSLPKVGTAVMDKPSTAGAGLGMPKVGGATPDSEPSSPAGLPKVGSTTNRTTQIQEHAGAPLGRQLFEPGAAPSTSLPKVGGEPIDRPVETHPFASPNNVVSAKGGAQFDPMTAEYPVQRSGPGFEAWTRNAGNQEELEAAARRQHEYINGEKFASATEKNPELVAEAKKWTNNVENEGTKGSNGSIQRAYKTLMGEDAHITGNQKIKQAGTMSRLQAMNAMIAKFSPEEIAKAARTPAGK